jgi:hypothetical protein
MHRQLLHHRTETDVLRHLGGGRDEHLLARGHTEVASVMLREVVTGESGLIGHLDQRQSVLKQLARHRARDVLDVVENSECGHGGRHVLPWLIA